MNRSITHIWNSVALIGASLVLAGCATNTSKLDSTAQQPATAQSSGKYRFIPQNENKRLLDGKTIFLVKDSKGNLGVTAQKQDLANANVDRVMYWPEKGTFTLLLDSRYFRCKPGDENRLKNAYSVCATEFKRIRAMAGGRVVLGVATFGLSEFNKVMDGEEHMEVDKERLELAFNAIDIDRALWLEAYRQSSSKLAKRSDLQRFLTEYSHDDPDGLADTARVRLKELDRKKTIFEAANASLPDISSYQKRFTPANPQRYCVSFKSDAAAMSVCKATVTSMVIAMATDKAKTTRQFDLCSRISLQTVGTVRTDLCKSLKQATCRAAASGDGQICDILNMNGQS